MAASTQAEVPQIQRARVPSFWNAVWSWLTTVDAKRIGILYGVSAFIFFLIAGIEAMIMRVQLYQPNEHLVSADVFDQLFTMHVTTMIFLVIMKLNAAASEAKPSSCKPKSQKSTPCPGLNLSSVRLA